MSSRYTVYCKQTVAEVRPEELLAGTREADLHTIAEDDVHEEIIVDALKQLRIENVDPPGFCTYRLCYRPTGMRQIEVHRWQTPEEVRVAAVETLENFVDKEHPALERIQAHLRQAVDIVSASFGSSLGEGMAPVLASEVTRWLAANFDGIIQAADGTWWELGRYHDYQPLRS